MRFILLFDNSPKNLWMDNPPSMTLVWYLDKGEKDGKSYLTGAVVASKSSQ